MRKEWSKRGIEGERCLRIVSSDGEGERERVRVRWGVSVWSRDTVSGRYMESRRKESEDGDEDEDEEDEGSGRLRLRLRVG